MSPRFATQISLERITQLVRVRKKDHSLTSIELFEELRPILWEAASSGRITNQFSGEAFKTNRTKWNPQNWSLKQRREQEELVIERVYTLFNRLESMAGILQSGAWHIQEIKFLDKHKDHVELHAWLRGTQMPAIENSKALDSIELVVLENAKVQIRI